MTSYKFCYAPDPSNMSGSAYYPFDNGTSSSQYIEGYAGTGPVLASIILPNNTAWSFAYNDTDATLTNNGLPVNYGTLSQITLPTGGTIVYTYETHQAGDLSCYLGGRWVTSRTVNANDGTGDHKWTYKYGRGVTTVTDPMGNDTVHTFGAGTVCMPLETMTQYYSGSSTSGTPVKTVTTTWNYRTDAVNAWTTAVNAVPTSVKTAWANNQYTSTKTYDTGFSYSDYRGAAGQVGIYGKPISETTSDYSGSALRTTNTQYQFQVSQPYLNANFIQLPAVVTVLNGSGTQVAQTTYGYDESNGSPQGVKGNLTSVTRWLNTSPAQSPKTQTIYNSQGMPSQTRDAKQTNPVNYYYDNTGAFLAQIQNALGSVYTAFDYNTGLLTSMKDVNNQITTEQYDIMERPTLVHYPDGGSTSYSYIDVAPFKMVATIASTPNPSQTSTTVFDGLGRVSQTQLSDPDGTDYTDTVYDPLGRVASKSNPHRGASNPTDGLTQYTYDAIGRTTQVTMPDGSTVNTDYSAFPYVTVTDEPTGRSRRNLSDALGRMTQVFEDPAGLNYETDYTYDALNNLLSVAQWGGANGASGARNRSFTYDSLSRLLTSSNPETGTICYLNYAHTPVV